MQVTAQDLRKISIFSRLDRGTLRVLETHAGVKVYDRGTMIFQAGDPLPAQLFAVFSGAVEIKKIATTGKETLFRILVAGEIFASPALFGNGIAPATAIAAQDCQILTIAREGLMEVMRHNPEVAFAMIAVLNDRIQTLHEILHSVVSERAIVRLAQLLLKTAEKELQPNQILSEGRLQTPLSYSQIARTIGITYEECVRLFKQLGPIVQYQRGQITIVNLHPLQQLARGETDLDAKS